MEDFSGFKPKTRSITDSSSPEFEFWRLQTPSCPQPDLISADVLFVDGVILPLRLVPASNNNPPDPNPRPGSEEISAPDPDPEPEPEAQVSSAGAPAVTASKRWRDMFKKKSEGGEKEGKKKEQKSRGVAAGASSAELNINLWPFSRSRSAGNACTRPKFGAPGTRKVNSAPCSRSNSTGESKSTRKWPASPGRAGVYLGRSSPVWQARRGASNLGKTFETHVRNAEKGAKKEVTKPRRSKTTVPGGAHGGSHGGAKPRVLNLNVPTCIGYRSHLGCRSDVMNSAVGVGGSSGSNSRGAAASGGGDSSAASNLFNLRSLFSKVY